MQAVSMTKIALMILKDDFNYKNENLIYAIPKARALTLVGTEGDIAYISDSATLNSVFSYSISLDDVMIATPEYPWRVVEAFYSCPALKLIFTSSSFDRSNLHDLWNLRLFRIDLWNFFYLFNIFLYTSSIVVKIKS